MSAIAPMSPGLRAPSSPGETSAIAPTAARPSFLVFVVSHAAIAFAP
jgi:hypothetical protein